MTVFIFCLVVFKVVRLPQGGGGRWGGVEPWCKPTPVQAMFGWLYLSSCPWACVIVLHLNLQRLLLFAPVTLRSVVKIAFHAPFSSPFLDFSTLYIHYFVYTVYDDFGGCWRHPRNSGQSAATDLTHLTATETDSGRHHVHPCDKKCVRDIFRTWL